MHAAKRFDEFRLRQSARRQLTIGKDSQIRIRLLLTGRFLKRNSRRMSRQPLAKPLVNSLPAGLVIVVTEIKLNIAKSPLRVEQVIYMGNGRTFDFWSILGPVSGR